MKSKQMPKVRLMLFVSVAVPALVLDRPAMAQSNSATVEDIVVTGTKFMQNAGQSALKSDVPVRDIPLSVSSYTKDFLDSISTTRVEDLYAYMPGVTRSGGSGRTLTLRGFSTGNEDRGTILIDGLPGLSSSFGSPATINIESVELVKGANSVLYGKAQPGGFLNIVTKKPQAKASTLVQLRGEGVYGNRTNFGNALNYTVSFDTTGPLNDNGSVLYRLIAERGSGDGWRDFTFAHNWYVIPSLTFRPTDDASLTIQYEFRREKWGSDEFLVAPNNDTKLLADFHTRYQEPQDFRIETGHSISLHFDVELSGDIRWRTRTRSVFNVGEADGYEQRRVVAVPVSAAFPSGWRVDRDDRHPVNSREYHFMDTNFAKKFMTGSVEHSVMFGFGAGIESFRQDRQQFAASNALGVDLYKPAYGLPPLPPTPDTNLLSKGRTLSVYFQDQITFSEQFKAVLSVRYDNELQTAQEQRLPNRPDRENRIDAIIPMVGAIFQPNRQLSFYASYSKSINQPKSDQLDALGRPLTKPEQGRQFEAGIKSNLYDNKLNATLALYDIQLTDFVNSLGNNIFEQLGGLRSRGIEVEVNAAPLPGWEFQLGYAYNDGVVEKEANTFVIGQRLLNAPEHAASFFTSYTFEDGPLKNFGASFGANYVGDRFSTFRTSATDLQRVFLDDYIRADFGLHYSPKDFEISLRFRNVFDEKYIEGATGSRRIIPGAPAGVSLTIQKKI